VEGVAEETQGCQVTRRDFVLSLPWAGSLGSATPQDEFGFERGPWGGPAIVRKLYLSRRSSAWPYPGADLRRDVAEIDRYLSELELKYPNQIRFSGGEVVQEDMESSAWLSELGDADAVLAFTLNDYIPRLLQKVVDAGRPTLIFSRPYSGHDWTMLAAFTQKGAKADVLASSDLGDLDRYVRLFGSIHHLRNSKVLLISTPARHPRTDGFEREFGTKFSFPSYLDLKAAYDSVDVKLARKAAEEFVRSASKVVEPSPAEIVDSLRLYLGLRKLLVQEKANAISIDCLGGFGRGELPAYPCVGFSKLSDLGLYGVCQCDLFSTMTQLLVTSFSGMPGFVSDPVIDASRNEVIHAHCVAPTALRGIGTSSPYIIRSHLEDNKGVSLQVLAPVGDAVTVAKFADAKRIMVSSGNVTGNVDDPRGCRTKIRTRVDNALVLLQRWSAALNSVTTYQPTRTDFLHRVVFFGDHVADLERLGRLAGFQVVHEARSW